jgi:hypothetical protein
MPDTRPADLVAEAERYLAVVAAFRAEGCEQSWRREPGGGRMPRARGRSESESLAIVLRRMK